MILSAQSVRYSSTFLQNIPRLEVEDPVPVQVEGLEDVLYEVLPPHARRKQRRELTENSRLINTK